MKKAIYFSIAALTVFTQARTQPADAWAWAQLFASCMTGGFIALRALASRPEDAQPTPTSAPPPPPAPDEL